LKKNLPGHGLKKGEIGASATQRSFPFVPSMRPSHSNEKKIIILLEGVPAAYLSDGPPIRKGIEMNTHLRQEKG